MLPFFLIHWQRVDADLRMGSRVCDDPGGAVDGQVSGAVPVVPAVPACNPTHKGPDRTHTAQAPPRPTGAAVSDSDGKRLPHMRRRQAAPVAQVTRHSADDGAGRVVTGPRSRIAITDHRNARLADVQQQEEKLTGRPRRGRRQARKVMTTLFALFAESSAT